MNLIQSSPKQAEFSESVLSLLAGRKADAKSGARADELSLSTLLGELRFCGWCIGGSRDDVVDTLRAAGFAVRDQKAGRSLLRFVSL